MRTKLLVLFALMLAGFGAHAQPIPVPGPTVAAIKQRGQLKCGIDSGIPGFAFQDSSGTWKGFDIG